MKNISETYTKREKNRYVIGLVGQNILYGVISSSLAYFMQFTVLIPAALVGVIVSAARIYDAVKDPIMGMIINRSKRPIKTYLLAVPVPTAFLTVLCFANGVYSNQNPTSYNIFIILFAMISFVIWETVFSLGDIPAVAFPSLLTTVEKDKTLLLTLRNIGAMASSISALAVQPIAFALSSRFGGTALSERNAFLLTAVVFSVFGGVLYQFIALGSNQRVTAENNGDSNQFRYFITNKILRKITASGILGALKSMTGVVLTPLVTYYYASKDPLLSLLYTFLFGAGSFIGLFISTLVIPALVERYGKIKVFIWTNVFCSIPNIGLFMLYLLYPRNMADILQVTVTFALMLIIGLCISMSNTVQSLIISDAVELEYILSGNRPTALFFSVQTFIIKIGAGISSLLAGLCYSAIHFSSDEIAALNSYVANGGLPRLDSEYSVLMNALFFMFTIPCAIGSLLSVVPFIKNSSK